MAAFGFSVGDFVSAIGLIARVSKALKDTDGASSEYQLFDLELRALKSILDHLQSLQPTPENIAHVNAIRALALTCQLPLNHFLTKIDKFHKSLGPQSSSNAFKKVNRKSQWALLMNEEVPKLRTHITAKVVSLNLLLSLQNTESLTRIESLTMKSLPYVMSKLETISSDQRDLRSDVHQNHATLHKLAQEQSQASDLTRTSLHQTNQALSNMEAQVLASSTAVVSMKQSWLQLANILRSLPREMLELIRKIAQTNMEIYSLLRSIQLNMSRTPPVTAQDCISFEDVLGRTKSLPYEFFKHFDMFDHFLQHHFKGLPGEDRILRGDYVITRTDLSGVTIRSQDWSQAVFPGSQIAMSIIIEHLRSRYRNRCPRPGCAGELKLDPSQYQKCTQCNFMVSHGPNLVPPNGGKVVKDAVHGPPPTDSIQGSTNAIINHNEQNGEDASSVTNEDEAFEIDTEQLEKERRELQAFKRIHYQHSSTDNRSIRPLIYMDITMGSQNRGRIIMRLFKDVVPQTVELFMSLCFKRDFARSLTFIGLRSPGIWIFSRLTGMNESETLPSETFDIKRLQPFLVYLVCHPQYGSISFIIVTTAIVSPRSPHLILVGQIVYGRPIIRGTKAADHLASHIVTDCRLYKDDVTFRFPPEPERWVPDEEGYGR